MISQHRKNTSLVRGFSSIKISYKKFLASSLIVFLFTGLFTVSVLSIVNAETIDVLVDSFSQSNDTFTIKGFFDNSEDIAVYQSFSVPTEYATYNLTSMVFRLAKSGSPTANLTACLYSHAGTFGTNSTPATVLSMSTPMNMSDLTTSQANYTFTFPLEQQYSMTNGTNYVAVLRSSNSTEGGTLDASNYVAVAYYFAGGHDGNLGNNNYGWSAQPGDMQFAVYANIDDSTGVTYDNLHVVSNQILDENETAISLNGFNYDISMDFSGFSYIKPDGTIVWDSYNATAIDQMLSKMHDYSAKCIRLGFVMDWMLHNTSGYVTHISNFVDNAWNYEIYIDLVPHVDNASTVNSFEDVPWLISDSINLFTENDFANAWGNVSSLFKDKPNVLFDLWNEPQGNKTVYFSGVQLAVNAIRATGANNVIILQYGYGVQIDIPYPSSSGSNMQWVYDYPITDNFNNLAYGFHSYSEDMGDSENPHYVTSVNEITSCLELLNVTSVASEYPLICGELGWNLNAENQTAEELWFTNMLDILTEQGIVGVQMWLWRSTTVFRALNTSGTNYDLSVSGLEFVNWMGGLSYFLEISSVSPEENATITSSTLNYEFTNTGNDTVSTVQVALYLSNGTQVGTNQTSLTGAFTGLTNNTYMLACSAAGVNGATDYTTVNFTVAIPPEPPPSVTVTISQPTTTPYQTNQILVSLSASGGTIDTIWYNVKNGSAWVYVSNQTYTAPHFITGYVNGTYTFYAFANNTDGSTDSATVVFTVAIPSVVPTVTNPTVTIVLPFNRTYITSTIPVELSTTGTVDAVWFNVKNGSAWIYTYNQTYTAATSLTAFVNGTYTFYAFATNSLGGSDEATVVFTVGIIPNPPLPQVNVDALWLFLYEGDFLGFAQAILVRTFLSFEAAIAMIIMLFMVPIYLRTKSLLLLSILWILIGGFLVVAVPLASGVGILFIALAVGGLLWRLFRPSGYG